MTRRWGPPPVSERCTSGTEVPRGLKSILLLAISTLVFLPGCSRPHPPYSAKDALQTFRIEPGFRIENFVAEPDIRSPSDMEWDEDGRIYVVEDPGYPLNTEGKVGRVILLEDTR